MSKRSLTGIASSKRIALAFAVTAVVSAGSPLVAISSASSGSVVPRPVSATFGDCKNDNSGHHYGYVCPHLNSNYGGSTSGSGGIIIAS